MTVLLDKDGTMDNVQQHNRSYLCSTVAERLIGIFPGDVIVVMTDEAPGRVNKQNSHY
jgi:hypothetical protein